MDTVKQGDGTRVMYRFRDGQTTLMPWAREFVHKVEFDGVPDQAIEELRHAGLLPT